MGVLLGETELQEQLMSESEEYRRLAVEHRNYSLQLEQLSNRHFLTEAEQVQETLLKKKKLLLKDQMYTILRKYRKQLEAGA